MITACIFCGLSCESLHALRGHSAVCDRHPAVIEVEKLKRENEALRASPLRAEIEEQERITLSYIRRLHKAEKERDEARKERDEWKEQAERLQELIAGSESARRDLEAEAKDANAGFEDAIRERNAAWEREARLREAFEQLYGWYNASHVHGGRRGVCGECVQLEKARAALKGQP